MNEDNLIWLEFVDVTQPANQRGKAGMTWQKVLIIIFSTALVFSLIWLGWIYASYKKGESLYANAKVQYVETVEDATGKGNSTTVDLDALQLINPDIKGWIYIEDTPISYPILWSGDDNTYLRHTYEGKYDIMGSILLSEYNDPDFIDQNNLIFGHNSHGETMFGTLKNYADGKYFNDHLYVNIILPGRTLKYRVFSAFETDSTSNVYTVRFGTENGYKSWKQNMATASVVDTDVKQVNNLTNTITLSTCSKNSGSERRFVVIAQLDDVTTQWND